MKKIIRIIAVALCVTTLGVMLCSCQYLEDKKDNRAVFTDDSKESIEFRGNTYKRISLTSSSFVTINSTFGTSGFVCEKDVPVLLSSMYGEPFEYDSSKDSPLILQCYRSDPSIQEYVSDTEGDSLRSAFNLNNNSYNYFLAGYNNDRCYVREDLYDDLKEELKSLKLKHYFYIKEYDPYVSDSENHDMYYDYKMEYTILDDKLTDAINQTLNNGRKIDYKKLKDKNSWSSFRLSYCDKHMMVTDEEKELYIFCDNTTGKYYLAPMMSFSYSSIKELIEAPDSYRQLFTALFADNNNNVYYGDDLNSYFETDEMDEYAYEHGVGDSNVI